VEFRTIQAATAVRARRVSRRFSATRQRWLWWAIDHVSGEVLAYVLADRKDKAFIELKSLLEPFGIMQFYSDGYGAVWLSGIDGVG
jgi:IS1 family transposase